MAVGGAAVAILSLGEVGLLQSLGSCGDAASCEFVLPAYVRVVALIIAAIGAGVFLRAGREGLPAEQGPSA